jgi:hypothetical protein
MNVGNIAKMLRSRPSTPLTRPDHSKRHPKKPPLPEFTTYQINQQECLRINILDSEKHYPLHIHSIGGQSINRMESGLGPESNQTTFPRIEKINTNPVEKLNYDHKDVIHLLNRTSSSRPQSACAFRNRQLSNNPFFFNLPEENERSVRFPGPQKRESHLKSFGANSDINLNNLNTNPFQQPTGPAKSLNSSPRKNSRKNSAVSRPRGLFV